VKQYVVVMSIIFAAFFVSLIVWPINSDSDDLIVLKESTTMSLNTPITNETAATLQTDMIKKSNKVARSTDLYLVLNSPGGSVDAGNRIIETAKGLPQRVHTISMFSASMSFILSQYLNNRYILSNTTMMTHRATVEEIGGQIPGSLVTRVNNLYTMITSTEKGIAARAGISLDEYRRLAADELWMQQESALNYHFADKLVRVRCDASLSGLRDPETMHILFLTVSVTFHKCPLITTPTKVEIVGDDKSAKAEELKAIIYNAFYNRENYAHVYGDKDVSFR
jgi:ATP-dependent Clp protease, protease subunit